MKRLAQSIVYIVLIVAVFMAWVLLSERNGFRQTTETAVATANAVSNQQAISAAEVVAANETAVAAEASTNLTLETSAAVVATAEAQILEAEAVAQLASSHQISLAVDLLSQQQMNHAYALALAAHQFRENSPSDIDYSVLLAIEAVRRQPDQNTITALRQSMELLPQLLVKMEGSHAHADSILFSEDGRSLITHGWYTTPQLWDTTTGERQLPIPDGLIFDWSADARYVVLGGRPGSRHVYDIASQKSILTLPDSTFGFQATFSPDSKLIAYSTDIVAGIAPADSREIYEYIFVVQDIQSGEEILRQIIVPAREKTVALYDQIAFSPDGKYVAGASLLRMDIWDMESAKIVAQLPLSISWPESVVFSPDSSRVAVTGFDGVQVWDLAQNREVQIDSLPGIVHSARFSSDSYYLVVARQERWEPGEGGAWYRGQDGTQVWDVRTGADVLRLPEVNMSAGFIGDSHQLLSINQDGVIQIWDVQTGQLLTQSQLYSQITTAINPNGTQIAGINQQGDIHLWLPEPLLTTQILSPMTVYESYRSPDNLSQLLYSPDGTTLVTASWDGQVRLWDSVDGRELESFHATDTINNLAYNHDGTALAVGGGNYPSPAPDWVSFGLTDIWEQSQGTTITLTHEFDVDDVQFSPDGQYFATVTNLAQLWNAQTGEEILTYESELDPLALAFTPQGDQLVILAANKAIVCDVQTGEVVQEFLPQDGSEFLTMALHPDGRFLAVTESRGIRAWDLQTNVVIAEMPIGRIDHTYKLTFSPGGLYLGGLSQNSQAVPNPNNTLDIWKTTDWQVVLRETQFMLNDFSFSPDDNSIVLGGNGGLARVLSMPDGREVNQWQYDGNIQQVAFRPDGKQIALLGWEKVALWYWNPEDWITETCTNLIRNFPPTKWSTHFGTESYHAICP